MGNYNSGRRSHRRTVEQVGCLKLGVGQVVKACAASGSWSSGWRWRRDGQTIDIGVMVVLDMPAPGRGLARLTYDNIRPASGVETGAQDYEVELVSTPCHLGGRRWWWLCPRTGRRCGKLYLPRGGRQFYSRQEYGLVYQVQRMDAFDVAHHQIDRAYAKIGATRNNYSSGWTGRPKGMHHRTYAKIVRLRMDGYDRLDAALAAHAAPILARADARRAVWRELLGE